MKILKWILKFLSGIFKGLGNNEYLGVVGIVFTSILANASLGNRYITLFLVGTAALGFVRVALKDTFGIETPYIKSVLKLFKFNKWFDAASKEKEFYKAGGNSYKQLKKLLNNKGVKDMNLIKKIGMFLRANKVTLSGNSVALFIYYEYVRELLETHKYQFNKEVYIMLSVYTVGLIVLSYAINGIGLEGVNKFLSRITHKNVLKVVEKIVEIDVTLETDFVKELLDKSYKMLGSIKVFIREEEYLKIRKVLDEVMNNVKKHEAKVALERRKYEDELIASLKYQEQVNKEQPQVEKDEPVPSEQPQSPHSRGNVLERYNAKNR